MSTKTGNRTPNIPEDWEAPGIFRDAGTRNFLAGESPDAATFDFFFYHVIQALTDLDTSITFDTLANRPAASSDNYIFFATDENRWYRSDGSTWNLISPKFQDEQDQTKSYSLKVIGGSLALEEV